MKKHGNNTMKNMVMRVLKKNSVVIVFCLIFYDCGGVFRMEKNYYNKGKKYCESCMKEYLGGDTVYLNKNQICIFKNKELFAVGKIKNNKKNGIWFFYKKYRDTLECYRVIQYGKTDSVIKWNRGLINESW